VTDTFHRAAHELGRRSKITIATSLTLILDGDRRLAASADAIKRAGRASEKSEVQLARLRASLAHRAAFRQPHA
jgi:hypothetical protein